MSNTPEFSFVLPCLNEVLTLEVCVQKCHIAAEKNNIDIEVVVADNGSTDGSIALAENLGFPLFQPDCHGPVEICFIKVLQSVGIEILPVRNPADLCFVSRNGSLATADDPFQHPHVLTETRPQPLALVALAEPIHMEYPRQVDNAFVHL